MDDPVFSEPNARKRVFDEGIDIPAPNIGWYRPAMEEQAESKKAKKAVNVV